MDTLKNIPTIHCDSCGWETKGNPPDWHNKECPKCKAIVINDTDMQIWNGIKECEELGIVTRDLKRKGIQVKINTANL